MHSDEIIDGASDAQGLCGVAYIIQYRGGFVNGVFENRVQLSVLILPNDLGDVLPGYLLRLPDAVFGDLENIAVSGHRHGVNNENYGLAVPAAHLEGGLGVPREVDIEPVHFEDAVLLYAIESLFGGAVIEPCGRLGGAHLHLNGDAVPLIGSYPALVGGEAVALLAVLQDDALQRFDIYRMPFGADALYQSAGVSPALSVERDADLLGAVP